MDRRDRGGLNELGLGEWVDGWVGGFYLSVGVGVLNERPAELFAGEIDRAVVPHHHLDANGLAAGLEEACGR